MNSTLLVHVVLAALSVGVLCIAGLQALVLIVAERIVRAPPHSRIKLQKLPPLESMERGLFQSIGLGFILLSLLVLSGLYSYHAQLFSQTALLQKTLLASLAWLVFAVLLFGRLCWGWRGRRVIWGTFGGIVVLIMAYLGTKVLWNL